MVNTGALLTAASFTAFTGIVGFEFWLDGKPLTARKRAPRHVRRTKWPVEEHLGNIAPTVSPFEPEQTRFREILGEKTPYRPAHRTTRPTRKPNYRPAKFQGRL